MQDKLYINGAFVDAAKGGRMDVIDPATEVVFAQVPAGTAEDVDAAVRAARAEFDTGPWPRMSGRDRAEVLRAVASGIERRKDELARIEVRDNGKPLAEAELDVADAAGCFSFYAGMAEGAEGDEPITVADPRFSVKAVREPVGVAAAIIPWNFPLLMAAWKVAPALAAGCTIVLKPSELTSLTALELADIAHGAGVPPGVLNVITGLGAEAGQPLAAHPGVDKIAFTGSVPTGSRLMAEAAHDIKRISLELGGKSPFIIFADSDLDAAVEWIMFGIFLNQGQVCSATSRVLVESAVYDGMVDRLAEASRSIRVGGGFEAGVKLGPLVSAGQLARVQGYIEAGRLSGAKLVAGGNRPPHLNAGYFLEPTIFADVPTASSIWTDEIFGPVVSLRKFDTEDEAVRLANDSRFGLAAAVMSTDLDRADRVAAALKSGIVWVNCSQPAFVEAPWGGYKQSGIGRELGRWGYENYLETKQITRFNAGGHLGWYSDPT